MAVEGEQTPGGTNQNPETPAGGVPPAAPEWIATLDPELRESPSLKKFKGKDWNEVGPTLFKSYHNLERFQIPGDDAGPEEVKKFRERLGVPDSPEKYEYKATPPPNVPWDAELEQSVKKLAHSAGLTPKQHQQLVEGWAQIIGTGADRVTANTGVALREAQEKLQSKWGGAYERNVGLVQRTVADVGVAGFTELLDTQVVDGMKLGNHPVMLEVLAQWGNQRLEDGYIAGDNLAIKASDAEAEAKKIMATQEYQKGDRALVKKVSDLMQIAHPGTVQR